jgi:hypothetical protein
MKCLLVAIALLGLVSLPLSNLAIAGKPPKESEKVKVCHIEEYGYVPNRDELVCRGHVVLTWETNADVEKTTQYHLEHADHIARPGRKMKDYCFRPLDNGINKCSFQPPEDESPIEFLHSNLESRHSLESGTRNHPDGVRGWADKN